MKRIVILIIGLVFSTWALAQTKKVYILPGKQLIFRVDEVLPVRWFYQAHSDSAWKTVGEQNIYVHERNQGKLFAVVYHKNFQITISDTVEFTTPHPNAGEPFIVDDRFYKTVVLDGYTWMAEDYDGDYATYEEAQSIANTHDNWILPHSVNFSYHKGRYTPGMSLYYYATDKILIDGEHGLMSNGAAGFDAIPNYNINNKEYPQYGNLTDGFYWMNGGCTPFIIRVGNKDVGFLAKYTFETAKVRLIKRPDNYNEAPPCVDLLWPFNSQLNVSTDPEFSWVQSVDPEGDSVYYRFDYNRGSWPVPFEGTLYTNETDFHIDRVFPVGEFKWFVNAYDNHGNSWATGNSRSFNTTTGSGALENPGEYGIQKLKLNSPAPEQVLPSQWVNVKYDFFSLNEDYVIYLGTTNPPAFAGNTQSYFFTKSDLMPDTTYYVQVKAIDRTTREIVAQTDVVRFYTNKKEEIVNTGGVGNSKSKDGAGGGTGASETEDFFDPQPSDGSLICARSKYSVNITVKSGIKDDGEFRFYIRQGSADGGWQLRFAEVAQLDANTKWAGTVLFLNNLGKSTGAGSVEWKCVFFDNKQGKETYKSPVYKLTLDTGFNFPKPSVTISGNQICWNPISGAAAYKLTFREQYRDCYTNRTSNGLISKRYSDVVTNSTCFTIPPCTDETFKYEVWVTAKDDGFCTSSQGEWTYVSSCEPKVCPEYLWKKIEDNKTGGSGGGGGSGSTLKSDMAIVATWQLSNGSWRAIGPLQNILIGEDSESKAIDMSVYTCQKGQASYLMKCGNFRIYTIPKDCMPLSDEDKAKAINKVHSYLLNNGCNPY